MTKDEVANVVKELLCNQFNKQHNELDTNAHLWDDLCADDLDFMEINRALDDNFVFSESDCLDIEYYRRSTIQDLIDCVCHMLCGKNAF